MIMEVHAFCRIFVPLSRLSVSFNTKTIQKEVLYDWYILYWYILKIICKSEVAIKTCHLVTYEKGLLLFLLDNCVPIIADILMFFVLSFIQIILVDVFFQVDMNCLLYYKVK
jgi:hypothetical protein